MLDIPDKLQRNDLTLATDPLGQGGQASVWRIEEYPRYLFKAYAPDLAVDGELLDELVACRAKMSDEDRALLDASASWPLATVTEEDKAVGVIIGEAPDRFLLDADGANKPAELQYLVMRDRAGQLGVAMPTPFVRLQISARLAAIMDLFARYEIVHGDISHRNVLWSTEPDAAVFVLDCDGASLRGKPSPLPVVTTPHWTDPRVVDGTIDMPDVDSDRLGLALTFYRTFYQRAGNFSDGTIELEVPDEPTVPDSVRTLCAKGLTNSTPRTSAEAWLALNDVKEADVGDEPELEETPPGSTGPNRFEFAMESPRTHTAAASVDGLAVDLLPMSPSPDSSGGTTYPLAADDTTPLNGDTTTPLSADRTLPVEADQTTPDAADLILPVEADQTTPVADRTEVLAAQPATVSQPAPTPPAGATSAPNYQATAAQTGYYDAPVIGDANRAAERESAQQNVPAYLVLSVFLGCLALGGLVGFIATRFIF